MTVSIEGAYRGAMRLYPAAWRAQHAEAALGILLDCAEAEGRDRADWRQLASLIANGVVARVDQLMPRHSRDLMAVSALLGTTAFALIDFVFFEWQPWTHTHLYPHRAALWELLPFSTPAVFAVIAWLLGALFWLCGQRVGGRVLFALSGLIAAALAVLTMHSFAQPVWFDLNSSSGGDSCCVLISGAALVALGDPDRRLRPALLAPLSAAVGAAILGLWCTATSTLGSPLLDYWRRDDNTLWRDWLTDAEAARLDWLLTAFALVLAVALGLGARRAARGMVAVLGQLAIVATCLMLLSESSFRVYGLWPDNDSILLMAALAAVALWGASRAARPTLHRLARGIRPLV